MATRRRFLQDTIGTLAGGLLASTGMAATSRKPRVDTQLRLAYLGLGGRSAEVVPIFAKLKNVRIVALCDPDSAVLAAKGDEYEKLIEGKPERFIDYRRVLDHPGVDAVVLAVPNHWHALMTIQACQAGKHVYVEKPVCHGVWEGRQMIKAAQKYGRIVGAGFQNRSDVGLRDALQWIQDGNLGAIKQVRGLCYRGRGSIGRRDTPLTPPKSVDYSLWLGPAEDLPIMRPKFHYDWHWVWNTGNGDMGNQGPHEMDLIRWVLGNPPHPEKVSSFGGRFAWEDAGETPNMQAACFTFADGRRAIFEVRNLSDPSGKNLGAYKDGPGVGVIVTCEGGEFRGGRGGGSAFDAKGAKTKDFPGDGGATHYANFVDSVLAGDASQLRAPLESSFVSSTMSHLANISWRTGEGMPPDAAAAALHDDDLKREVYDRFSAQLAAMAVDFKSAHWGVSRELAFDSAAEHFTGDGSTSANWLLRRKGRPPFEIPADL